jgi:uncharacterized protein (DUF2236 family)
MTCVGRLLGIPAGALPADLAAFGGYVDEMVATLAVGDDARAIAAELLRPTPGLAPAILAARALTAGLLPPRLRAAYGLAWGPTRATLLDASARVSRAVLPHIPPPLRAPPRLVLPPSTRV